MKRKRLSALGALPLAGGLMLAQCGGGVQDRHLPYGDVQYALTISNAEVRYYDHDGDGHYHPYAYWSRYRTSQDVQNCLAYVNGAYPALLTNNPTIAAAACGAGQTPGVGWAVPASPTHTIVNV